jgi:hypothetical protein
MGGFWVECAWDGLVLLGVYDIHPAALETNQMAAERAVLPSNTQEVEQGVDT